MDENKDFAAAEQKAEEKTDTVADTEAAEVAESVAEEAAEVAESAPEEAAEVAESAAEEVAEAAAEAPKKSFVLQNTIIVSMAIVIVALLAVLVIRLFVPRNSITDTNLLGGVASTSWHYAPENLSSQDEAPDVDIFFFFEPDGKLSIKSDSIERTGSYSLQYITADDEEKMTEEEKQNIGSTYLLIENTGAADGSYLYKVSGNSADDKEMILTNLYVPERKMAFDKKKTYKTPEIEREGDFTGDDDLFGKWKMSSEQGSTTYQFNEDGTFVMEVKNLGTNGQPLGSQRLTGIYNCEDGKMTTSTIQIAQVDDTLKYKVDGDELHFYQPGIDRTTGQIVEQDVVLKRDK